MKKPFFGYVKILIDRLRAIFCLAFQLTCLFYAQSLRRFSLGFRWGAEKRWGIDDCILSQAAPIENSTLHFLDTR